MSAYRSMRDKARKAQGKLPLSFVPAGAVADLFGDADGTRAAELFFEISERRGIREAERIFTDTVERARKLVPRSRGRHKGDDGGTARRNAALLDVYHWKREQDPTFGPYKFARWVHEKHGYGASVHANYEKLRKLLPK